MFEQHQNWELTRQHSSGLLDEAKRERMMQDGKAATETPAPWHDLAETAGEALIGLGQALKQKAHYSST